MQVELQALAKTGTWDLVDLSPGKTPVGCKWVYKIKTHSDGSIKRYKSLIVAKEFAQEYGIDYEGTFSLVVNMAKVCTIIVVAVSKNWMLH